MSPTGPIEVYFDAGVRGPPGRFRPTDFFGLGIAYARTAADGTPRNHTITEVTYQAAVTGWLTVQPEAQLVFAGDRTVVIGAIRTTIAF